MEQRQVRKATAKAVPVQSGSTAALAFVFGGMILLGILATVHAFVGIISDFNGTF